MMTQGRTEPHILDNWLWVAFVHACDDKVDKIWEQLKLTQQEETKDYLIPNAKLWMVRQLQHSSNSFEETPPEETVV